MLSAQSLTDLYDEVENSPQYISIAETIDSQSVTAEAERYDDGWSAGAEMAGAYPKDGSSSGGEFALSVGKEFNLKRSALGRFMRFNKEYAKLRKKVELKTDRYGCPFRRVRRLQSAYGPYGSGESQPQNRGDAKPHQKDRG